MSAERARETTRDGIAVIGVACRAAGAHDTTILWRNLVDGVDALGPSRTSDDGRRWGVLEDIACFDHEFFSMSQADAIQLDPQHRLLLETVWHAFEDAGHIPGTQPERTTCYVSCGINRYARLLARNGSPGTQALLGNIPDSLAGLVAYKFDIQGECLAIQTACSASLVAVHHAVRGLRNGDTDLAIVASACLDVPGEPGDGGTPHPALSPDGRCRPFDARANGTVGGDAVAAVILRRARDASEAGDRIYAVIHGTAVGNDGARRGGFAVPGLHGQTRVVQDALADAALPATEIGYVETHGTGTLIGDAIEIEALQRVYGGERTTECLLGSIKPNIGHSVTASGLMALIKVSLAMAHEELPPTLNFERGNLDCRFDTRPFRVVTERTPWAGNGRYAGISAFGVGGTNAHVIAGPRRREPARTRRATAMPVVVSARDDQDLAVVRRRLAEFARSERQRAPAAAMPVTVWVQPVLGKR